MENRYLQEVFSTEILVILSAYWHRIESLEQCIVEIDFGYLPPLSFSCHSCVIVDIFAVLYQSHCFIVLFTPPSTPSCSTVAAGFTSSLNLIFANSKAQASDRQGSRLVFHRMDTNLFIPAMKAKDKPMRSKCEPKNRPRKQGESNKTAKTKQTIESTNSKGGIQSHSRPGARLLCRTGQPRRSHPDADVGVYPPPELNDALGVCDPGFVEVRLLLITRRVRGRYRVYDALGDSGVVNTTGLAKISKRRPRKWWQTPTKKEIVPSRRLVQKSRDDEILLEREQRNQREERTKKKDNQSGQQNDLSGKMGTYLVFEFLLCFSLIMCFSASSASSPGDAQMQFVDEQETCDRQAIASEADRDATDRSWWNNKDTVEEFGRAKEDQRFVEGLSRNGRVTRTDTMISVSQTNDQTLMMMSRAKVIGERSYNESDAMTDLRDQGHVRASAGFPPYSNVEMSEQERQGAAASSFARWMMRAQKKVYLPFGHVAGRGAGSRYSHHAGVSQHVPGASQFHCHWLTVSAGAVCLGLSCSDDSSIRPKRGLKKKWAKAPPYTYTVSQKGVTLDC
ncbi:hypothetical protein C8J56DRAFT_1133524 [Mycena floridula]|nr:hypothetical protein C8J56DRAFT_1133524 [Mycena floridula]